MKKILLILLALLFLSGCATHKVWYCEDRKVESAVVRAAIEECGQEPITKERHIGANAMRALMWVTVWIPGVNLFTALLHWAAFTNYEKAMNECMFEKGYTFKEVRTHNIEWDAQSRKDLTEEDLKKQYGK